MSDSQQATLRLELLSQRQIQAIHDASLAILRDTGVVMDHDEALKLLADAGAQVDFHQQRVRLSESLVMEGVAQAGKQFVIYGRDPERVARFGHGDLVLMSSPGQYAWIDTRTGQRRQATIQDARDAILLGDALPNVTIVGSMAAPGEVPVAYRDVLLTAELVKGTTKPTRTWIANGRTARYVMEIYRAVAGGEEALRQRPMTEAFLEPISPLGLPRHGLDVLIEFARAGQAVSFGPMAMTSGTAPGTLAGTLAQENAEILAGIVISQLVCPGAPVTYGGIPHVMDPRTSICSFGSPEQSLMAAAMIEIARFYGFPVYVNVGLTDAKVPDVQAGIEKGTSLLLAVLAGADTFGHAGICGTDHAGSLAWLLIDNEAMAYVKRIQRGFEVTDETLATGVVEAVGPRGNFLAEEHTVRHLRKEIWAPGPAWTRQSWDQWEADGKTSMGDRAVAEVQKILNSHRPEPIDEHLAREIDRIVQAARSELS
jgi:trimethylamine--corrinoid protein Co-methyltransferase